MNIDDVSIQIEYPPNGVTAVAVNAKRVPSQYTTRSADFWSIQYQYAALVSVSPSIDPVTKIVWQRTMQYAYGKYVAAIKASLHPRVALAVNHEIGVVKQIRETRLLEEAKHINQGTMGSNELGSNPVRPGTSSIVTCRMACWVQSSTNGILVCTTCKSGCHASCLDGGVPFEESFRDFQCVECSICPICNEVIQIASDGNTSPYIACSLCTKKTHRGCAKGPIGNWLCSKCIECNKCCVPLQTSVTKRSNYSRIYLDGELPIIDTHSTIPVLPKKLNARPLRLCRVCKITEGEIIGTWIEYCDTNIFDITKEGEQKLSPEDMASTVAVYDMLNISNCKACDLEFTIPISSLSIVFCETCKNPIHSRCMVNVIDTQGKCSYTCSHCAQIAI